MAHHPNSQLPVLTVLSNVPSQSFTAPVKRINEGEHVAHFLKSKAYSDIMLFILQLNRSLFPSRLSQDGSTVVKAWELSSQSVTYSKAVQDLQALIECLRSLIESAPPDPGPRRFGNVAFRRWHELASSQAPDLFQQYLPEIPTSAHIELLPYLLSSFGSAQRLDYGSGHELSFLAFLAGLWKLGFFVNPDLSTDEMSRSIVLGVIEPYLNLIRQLIGKYTLEPAGSHGVWGLDDHSFVPYIFGSAQLGSPIPVSQEPPPPTPTEGSLDSAPPQSDVTDATKSRRWAKTNMYFSAIAFIHDVKKGPFWEHSPMLYDISGVQKGWSKINKGMLKMYVAEVLGKFPVVQHFPFGSLFSWDLDPKAGLDGILSAPGQDDIGRTKASTANSAGPPLRSLDLDDSTKAPWAASSIPPPPPGGTKAPWASTTPAPPPVNERTKAPWATRSQIPSRGTPLTRGTVPGNGLRVDGFAKDQNDSKTIPPPAKAPWSKDV